MIRFIFCLKIDLNQDRYSFIVAEYPSSKHTFQVLEWENRRETAPEPEYDWCQSNTIHKKLPKFSLICVMVHSSSSCSLLLPETFQPFKVILFASSCWCFDKNYVTRTSNAIDAITFQGVLPCFGFGSIRFGSTRMTINWIEIVVTSFILNQVSFRQPQALLMLNSLLLLLDCNKILMNDMSNTLFFFLLSGLEITALAMWKFKTFLNSMIHFSISIILVLVFMVAAMSLYGIFEKLWLLSSTYVITAVQQIISDSEYDTYIFIR